MQLSFSFTSTCHCCVSTVKSTFWYKVYVFYLVTCTLTLRQEDSMFTMPSYNISEAADWCFCQGRFWNLSLAFLPFIILSVNIQSLCFTIVLSYWESLEEPLLHGSIQEMGWVSTYEAYALEDYLAHSLIYSGNNLEHFQCVHTLFVQHGLDSSLTSQTCSQGSVWDKEQDRGLFQNNKASCFSFLFGFCSFLFF